MQWKSEEVQSSGSSAGAVEAAATKVAVSKIDMRAQYAFFEYTVRTSDNVELLMRGTIFWQVGRARLLSVYCSLTDPWGRYAPWLLTREADGWH